MAVEEQQIITPENNDYSPAITATAWGTWEELLLAYAVNRYGTKNWDSISSELRKRTSKIHITPNHCQQKYIELKSRFNDVIDDVTRTKTVIPWLDDLRKQRVVELQRELQNHDLYIESLQTKVKKLTEERQRVMEKSLKIEIAKPVDDESERSMNGSNGNLEKEKEEKPEVVPVREEDSSNRPGEPEVEKSEPDGSEEEEVKSSASKSRNERGGGPTSVEMKGGDEGENESTDSIPVRSLPLVDFLHKVNKLASPVFDRRLDRQEKLRYKNLIRQHIDYGILQTRLKEGWYSDGNDKFFRDLLLLVNNTRIFFPKESLESAAAVELRQLILKEIMSKKKQKNPEKQTSSKPANLPPKRVSEPPESLLLKPKLVGPIVVCRKRSSITAKAAGSSSGADRRKEQMDLKLTEETPKRSRDSFPMITKKKGKNIEKNQEKTPTNETTSDTKTDKKKKISEAEEKKQSAAKFLNRMKRCNEPLLNSLKNTLERGGNSENDSKGGGEQKRGGGSGNKGGGGSVGGDGKKDHAPKKSSGGRQVKEQGSPAKRSVGRPPKRVATPILSAVLGKRNRESVEADTLGTKQTKKRSKR